VILRTRGWQPQLVIVPAIRSAAAAWNNREQMHRTAMSRPFRREYATSQMTELASGVSEINGHRPGPRWTASRARYRRSARSNLLEQVAQTARAVGGSNPPARRITANAAGASCSKLLAQVRQRHERARLIDRGDDVVGNQVLLVRSRSPGRTPARRRRNRPLICTVLIAAPLLSGLAQRISISERPGPTRARNRPSGLARRAQIVEGRSNGL
jgi:hypothetical protein